MAGAEFITDAAAAASTCHKQGARWLFEAGGVRPRRGPGLKGRCSTLAQREEIALAPVASRSAISLNSWAGRCRGSSAATPTGWDAVSGLFCSATFLNEVFVAALGLAIDVRFSADRTETLVTSAGGRRFGRLRRKLHRKWGRRVF